jgi:bifunctional DNase/RNase
MLRMTVEGVGFDHLRQTVVVLKDWDSQKILPIWIGAFEAKSIALQLEGTIPPRPLSHDLLMSCIRRVNGRITRVVINDLQDSTFYATIDIDTPHGLRHIDSRPSDAIALAVRARCPVFVDGSALEALIDISNQPDALSGNNINSSSIERETSEFETSSSSLTESSEKSASPDDELDRFRRLVGDLDL